MTLTEFLLARIAEDEAPILEMRAQYTDVFDGDGFRPWQSDWGNVEVCQTGPRALAECEAKRQIVDLGICGACAIEYQPCDHRDDTLRLLALPYADHPDFDPAWRLTPV